MVYIFRRRVLFRFDGPKLYLADWLMQAGKMRMFGLSFIVALMAVANSGPFGLFRAIRALLFDQVRRV